MEALAGRERRRHIRKPVAVEILLGCDNDFAKAERVSVHDISLSGIAIHSVTVQLALNDKVFLCFAQQRSECTQEHVIEATVVHANNGHVGIRFDYVGINVLHDIRAILRDERIF